MEKTAQTKALTGVGMKYLILMLCYPCITLGGPFPQIKDITFDDEVEIARAPSNIAEIKTDKEPERHSYSTLKINGVYGPYRIRSIDKSGNDKADLNSDPSPGLELSWTQRWGQAWYTGFRVLDRSIVFEKFGTGNLTNKRNRLSEMEFYSALSPSKNFYFQLSFGQKNILITKAKSAGVVTIEAPTTNFIGTTFGATLHKKDSLHLGLIVGYKKIFGQSVGNYSLENGHEYFFSPTLSQQLKNARFDFSCIYLRQDIETSITKQELSSLGTKAGMSFDIGK